MSDVSGDASYLMNNSAFLEAVKSAQEQCITAAMACQPRDDEGRRRLLDAALTVTKVVSHLNALVIAQKTGDQTNVLDFYETQAREHWASRRLNP